MSAMTMGSFHVFMKTVTLTCVLQVKVHISKKPRFSCSLFKRPQSGAVRKGELLRGEVSQGRPHPLSMALRCEGQTLNNTKKQLGVKPSVCFFFLAERWHDVGYNVINGLARR